jgi:hypothetical protein
MNFFFSRPKEIDLVKQLPVELLRRIFENFSQVELLVLSWSCDSWRRYLLGDPYLWYALRVNSCNNRVRRSIPSFYFSSEKQKRKAVRKKEVTEYMFVNLSRMQPSGIVRKIVAKPLSRRGWAALSCYSSVEFLDLEVISNTPVLDMRHFRLCGHQLSHLSLTCMKPKDREGHFEKRVWNDDYLKVILNACCNLTSFQAKDFFDIEGSCFEILPRSLKSFDLSFMLNVEANHFSKALMRMGELQELSLKIVPFSSSVVFQLLARNCKNLRFLSLEFISNDGDFSTSFQEFVTECVGLTHLCLPYCKPFGDKELMIMVNAHMRGLQHLEISGSSISKEGLVSFTRHYRTLRSIIASDLK